MIRQLVLCCIIAVMILIAGRARANENPEATKILEFYRVEDYLKDAMSCMERHLNAYAADVKMTPAQKQQLASLIKRIYPEKNLYKIFKASFSEAFTAEKIAQKKEFLNTPGGIKLRQAYRSAFASGSSVRQNYYDKNSASLLTPNRKNSILTFITSSEQDRSRATLESRCRFGVALAYNAMLSPTDRSSARQIKDSSVKSENSYIEESRKKYEIFDFFLFKDHTQKEIDQLSLYYSSADGTPFTKAYKKALSTTMEAAANTLLTQVTTPTSIKKKK